MFIAHVLKVADNEYISEIYIAEDKARAIDRAVQDCQYSNVLANYLDEDSILTMQGLLEDKEDGNTETAMLADDVKMKYDAG
jgi:hypothetical protein